MLRRGLSLLRNFLAVFGALVLLACVLAWAFRLQLSERVAGRFLKGAGVEVRGIEVKAMGLDGLQLGPLELVWQGQTLRVGSARLTGLRPFTPAAGELVIDSLSLGLDLDALRRLAPLPVKTEAVQVKRVEPPALPMPIDALRVNGRLSISPGAQGQALVFQFSASPVKGSPTRALGNLSLEGLGLKGALSGGYDWGSDALSVLVRETEVDIATLRGPLEAALGPLLGEGMSASGRLRISGEAGLVGGRLEARSVVLIEGAQFASTKDSLSVEGISGRIEFTDALGQVSAPRQVLRISRVSMSGMELADVELSLQLLGGTRVRIESMDAKFMGGRVGLEPCELDLGGTRYAATLLLQRVDVAELLKLFPVANASATGLADGRVPMSYGPAGLDFGRGWLSLSPGAEGTLRLEQPGLLTGDMDKKSMAYPILKQVEDGMLNLRVKALRVDIQPIDTPEGRSATLHVDGEPIDPLVKAPVTLEININGPLAPLINWGLNNSVSVGPAPAK